MQALKFEGSRSGERGGSDSALAAFLTKRAAANPILGNYLLWYLIVEADDPKWNDMYTKVKNRLIEEIVSVRIVRRRERARQKRASKRLPSVDIVLLRASTQQPNGQSRYDVLRWQRDLLNRIGQVYQELGNLNRLKKVRSSA